MVIKNYTNGKKLLTILKYYNIMKFYGLIDKTRNICYNNFVAC